MTSALKSGPLESAIEAEGCRRARSRGWIAIKQGGAQTGNKRGWPDRLFIKGGVYVFVEYKRPGRDLTPQQERRIAELREQQCLVFVCYSADESTAILDQYGSYVRDYFPGCEDL